MAAFTAEDTAPTELRKVEGFGKATTVGALAHGGLAASASWVVGCHPRPRPPDHHACGVPAKQFCCGKAPQFGFHGLLHPIERIATPRMACTSVARPMCADEVVSLRGGLCRIARPPLHADWAAEVSKLPPPARHPASGPALPRFLACSLTRDLIRQEHDRRLERSGEP